MTRAGLARMVTVLALGMLATIARGEMSAAMVRLENAEAEYNAALDMLRQAEAELHAAREAVAAETASRTQQTNQHNNEAQANTAKDSSKKADPATPPAQVEEKPKEPGFFTWKTWKKSIAFGLDGTSGNSDRLTGHLKLTFDRNEKGVKTHLDVLYRNSENNGNQTENRVRANFRNDWLAKEGSKWLWWAKGTYEYDDFKPWQHRVSAHAGFGYDFVKEQDTKLVWRMGFGGTQTYGGTNDDFRPEALLTGVDFTHKLKEGQKLTAGTECFIDVSDTQEYRLNTSVDYEILLDKDTGMILRLGLDHRFDSEPGGPSAKNSDFDYSMSLGWKF